MGSCETVYGRPGPWHIPRVTHGQCIQTQRKDACIQKKKEYYDPEEKDLGEGTVKAGNIQSHSESHIPESKK